MGYLTICNNRWQSLVFDKQLQSYLLGPFFEPPCECATGAQSSQRFRTTSQISTPPSAPALYGEQGGKRVLTFKRKRGENPRYTPDNIECGVRGFQPTGALTYSVTLKPVSTHGHWLWRHYGHDHLHPGQQLHVRCPSLTHLMVIFHKLINRSDYFFFSHKNPLIDKIVTKFKRHLMK